MGRSREFSTFLLSLAACLLLHLAQGHPVCLDFSAPAPYPESPAFFCQGRPPATWGVAEGSCCDAEQDAQIAVSYASLALALTSVPNAAACAPLVQSLLCQSCNPFEGHLWARGALMVCSEFFAAIRSACGIAFVKSIKQMGLAIFEEDLYNIFYCGPFDSVKYYGATPPMPNLRPAFPNLAGLLPAEMIDAVPVPDSSLWWAVSKSGKVVEFDGASAAAATTGRVVFDLSANVYHLNIAELGLLGLAFTPTFGETNRRFYVNYIGLSANATATTPPPGVETRIACFTFEAPAGWPAAPVDAAEAAAVASATLLSEQILLTFDQPTQGHNGGWVGFGPLDHYLYVSSGDGGGNNDPNNNSQNLGSLLGKMLRIDVNPPAGSSLPYAIPDTNPFAGSPVFAYGLRNPWRCRFDARLRLWCGDVGQDAAEEVNVVTKGKNYGWKGWEGVGRVVAGSAAPRGIPPRYTYCHSAGQATTKGCDTTVLGSAIMGGAVYRGLKYRKWLTSRYIFVDHESFALAALKYDTAAKKWAPTVLLDSVGFRPVGIVEGRAPNYELFIVEFLVAEHPMIYEFRCGPLCLESVAL